MSAQQLTNTFVSLETNADYSEAVILLQDGSRLCFCHRVGERWAKAVGRAEQVEQGGVADEILAGMGMFRLNGKHLEVFFTDGSRWERRFR